MNILIADDQPTNLKLLRAQLRAEGHVVLEAADGVEALALLKRERVDAVISDILMPNMDGYRLCYEVRKQERLAHVPFIFYTATYTSPGDEKLCYDLGADKYLKKPAGSAVILAALDEARGAARRARVPFALSDEMVVLKEYNEQLVNKLQEKNNELSATVNELRRTESLKGAILESSLDSIITIDHEGKIVEFNPAAEATFGLTRERALGASMVELIIPPRLRDAHRRGFALYLATGVGPILGKRLELQAIRADGTEFPIEIAIRAIGAASKPMFTGFIRDITERKRTEAALRESEQNYRTLADSGQALIWKSGTDKQYYYFNRVWLNFTGRTLEQEQGNGWTEGVHPDDRARCMDVYQMAFDRRQEFSMDFRLRRHDGEYRWIQDDGTPCYGASGEFTGYIGHCLDITERKRVEDVVWESERMLSTLMDNLPGMVYRCKGGPNWIPEFVSAGVVPLTGYRPDELIAPSPVATPAAMIHPDDLKWVRGEIQRANADSRQYTLEYRLITAAGDEKWVWERGCALHGPAGEIVGIEGFITDLTARKQAEQALARTLAQLDAAQERAHLGSWERDQATGAGSWSREMYRIFERDPALGVPDFDEFLAMVDPAHRPEMLNHRSRALESTEPVSQDFRLNLANGVVKHVNATLQAVRDRAGRVVRLVGTALDVTERKQTEAALRENMALRNAILDSASYSIITTDTQGRIRTANPAAEKMLGYTAQEMLGLTPERIHDPDEMARRAAELSRELDYPVPPGVEVLLAKPRLTGKYEERQWTYIRKNGSRFPVLLAMTPLLNADQQTIGFVGIASDITERRRAEEALRESERRFSDMLRNMELVSLMLDDKGRVMHCNDFLLRLTGWQRMEVIGRDWFELFIPPEAANMKRVFADLLAGRPAAWHHDSEILTRSGERRMIRWNNTVLRSGSGKAIGTASIGEDITARKQAEQALQEANTGLERKVAERTMELQLAKERAESADRLKSQFLANMSHELRTPLNAIIGFTGTLLMRLPGALNPQQEEQLNIVQSSARHLLSLINDLLDLAKIESGKMQLRPESVACRKLLEEIATTLRPLAEKKGLQLTLKVPSQEIRALTDARALKQIVLNLCNNAIKFTDTGSVTLELKKPRDNQPLEVGVTDTGIGIRPEDQDKLFEAFAQMDSTHREGTGLGLHLSRRLAHLIGGKIEFSSQHGKGSRFWLTLPLE